MDVGENISPKYDALSVYNASVRAEYQWNNGETPIKPCISGLIR